MKRDTRIPAQALDTTGLPTVGLSLDDLDNAFLLGKERCPACDGPFVVPVRYLVHNDKDKLILMRHCMDCRSFWNPPVRVGEEVAEEQETVSSVNGLDFHLNVEDRNAGMARNLFAQLEGMIDFSSVLEIGCGTGTALSVAASMGKKVLGYDINGEATEAGRQRFHIDLRAEHWTSETVSEQYDLVMCISTLEHFVRPLPMMRELAKYAQRMRSLLFISVPCVQKKHWPLLMNADPDDKTSIFRFVSGHFTHFTPEALRNAIARYGCRTRYVPPHPEPPHSWNGTLYDFRDDEQRLRASALPERPGRIGPEENPGSTLSESIKRLAGRPVYFWGCGKTYQAKKHLFSSLKPRCILVDSGSPEGNTIDGLPVCHPQDVLSWGGDPLPIVVFNRDTNRIYQAIRDNWPQYTDIVFCNEP